MDTGDLIRHANGLIAWLTEPDRRYCDCCLQPRRGYQCQRTPSVLDPLRDHVDADPLRRDGEPGVEGDDLEVRKLAPQRVCAREVPEVGAS